MFKLIICVPQPFMVFFRFSDLFGAKPRLGNINHGVLLPITLDNIPVHFSCNFKSLFHFYIIASCDLKGPFISLLQA